MDFSNLSTALKILIDTQYLELLEKHKKLNKKYDKIKLELFWQKYGLREFRRKLKYYNMDSDYQYRCDCNICCLGKRISFNGDIYPNFTYNTFNCILQPRIEKLAAEHGIITSKSRLYTEPNDDPVKKDNDDCHIGIGPEGNWVYLSYGKKLLNKPLDDPEMIRWKNFVKDIYKICINNYEEPIFEQNEEDLLEELNEDVEEEPREEEPHEQPNEE